MQHDLNPVVFKSEQQTKKTDILLHQQLITQCRQNNRKAQLQLYRKYCDGMYVVAFNFLRDSYLAEEAMQEGFIKAFSKLHQFEGEVTFGAWLKKIVINKCLDILKAKKRELLALNENLLLTTDEEDNWQIDDGIGIDLIKKAIEELPANYRYALMLFLMEGYDHQEIAEILGITEVASRTLVHRGKKKLQDKLKGKRNGTGY